MDDPNTIHCLRNIQRGSVVRRIATIVIFACLVYFQSQWSSQTCAWMIVSFLIILDCIDYPVGCDTKTWNYQYRDKINDLLSYLLVGLCFPLYRADFLFYMFVCIRSIGVFYFITTRNAQYLVLFPDFIKEYLLLRFALQITNPWIMAIFFFCKMGFEYYFHTLVNHKIY